MVVSAMEAKHGRGYVYAIQYHIVWCVKYRRKVLVGDIETDLLQQFGEIASSHSFTIEAQSVMPDHVHLLIAATPQHFIPDHVHLLIAATPQHFIPDLIKVLKGISARKLFMQHPELKKRLWGGHLWNPSYFVGTISEHTEAQVRQYIANQKSDDALTTDTP
jgi:putative transposase